MNKVEAWHGALFLLAQKEVQAQDALLLLRCFPKKLNFQLRALPPDVTCLAADRLDENLLQSIQIRFNLPFESPFSLHTLHAPRNHGGLNIDKAVDLADQSFVSSMAASVPNIRMTRVWKNREELSHAPAPVPAVPPSHRQTTRRSTRNNWIEKRQHQGFCGRGSKGLPS